MSNILVLPRPEPRDARPSGRHRFQWITPQPDGIDAPDPLLVRGFGAERCLRLGLLPWRRSGGATLVLSPDPEAASRHLPMLEAELGPVRLARCRKHRLGDALMPLVGPAMVARAEARVPLSHSCRGWDPRRLRRRAAGLGLGLALALALAPGWVLALICAWVVLTLALSAALKLATAVIALATPPAIATPTAAAVRQPVVSLLVPLYRERQIAEHLLARLERLDYPRDRLDLCLIVEDHDAMTRAALDAVALPPWAQVICVPEGTLRTKPRALNFALEFARGTIIGIYDAEDAPAPDQLTRITGEFARCGPEVACLQGVLDFYNCRSNWMARCFALEYATWFRVVLPGLQRLGLAVPLGGTTLFLRRHAIEEVGGWDAHNVTEDADLGIRLARHGYRTRLVDTVTEEEANARAWPWVKQRSRWLKGYAVTWAVAMHDPRQLWRDLGSWRFFGVQLLFLGALTQFLMAPLLWSFWLVALGLPHPMTALLPAPVWTGLVALFLASEAVMLGCAALAARRAGKPWLGLWAPALMLYFPLATLAAWKGLIEVITKPYYWDKTAHGIFAPATAPAAATPPPRLSPRRASAG